MQTTEFIPACTLFAMLMAQAAADGGGGCAGAKQTVRGQPVAVEVAPPPTSRPQAMLQGGKLAVLDFRNFAADLKPENVRYFADRVREATLQAAPQMEVMTRENLLVLLQASGKDLAQCEGECEVDTGRRIGADAIISGEIQKLGSSYKITMRLHETHAGRLLGASVASGTTLDELDASAAQATARLLEPLSRPASPPAEPVQTPGARY
jgi:hypothetical protein